MTETKRETLTVAERRTRDAMVRLTRDNGGIPPQVQELAADMGVDRTTVSHCLSSIAAKGWIRRVAGRYAMHVEGGE